MSWLRRMLAALGARRAGQGQVPLDRKWDRHHETIRRADRVIEAYRQLDLVLVTKRK